MKDGKAIFRVTSWKSESQYWIRVNSGILQWVATIAGVGVEKPAAGKIDVAMQSSLYEASEAATNIILAYTGLPATSLTWQDFFQKDPDILADLQEHYPKV